MFDTQLLKEFVLSICPCFFLGRQFLPLWSLQSSGRDRLQSDESDGWWGTIGYYECTQRTDLSHIGVFVFFFFSIISVWNFNM